MPKKSPSPSRQKLTRKSTIEQVVEDGKSFLQGGTYDGPDYFPDSPTGSTPAASGDTPTPGVLGKRKVTPVTRYVDEIEIPQPRPRSVSPVRRARSPPRKKAKPSTPAKAKPSTRSASPKKKSSGVRAARKPTPATLPLTPAPKPTPVVATPAKHPLPISWMYKSEKPSFGVHAGRGKCWMANENGDIFGFNTTGEMERHIKLPAGVKSIVSDMSMWLYAGCDNGIVYDLSHEAEPREAYRFDDLDDSKLMPAAQSLALLDDHYENVVQHIESQGETQQAERKPRHIVFNIDQSWSMNGDRIKEVAANMQMIYEHHLRQGDLISLVTFDTYVKLRFSRVVKGGDRDDELRAFIYSKEFLSCDNMTAFYDAMKLSYDQFDEAADEDQWVIALTDGDDNKSKLSQADIVDLAKGRDVNLITIYVACAQDSIYHRLKSMCDATKKGLAIFANMSDGSNGITSAFKHIAQLLSSRVMWMDIRDGLLTLSDDEGRVVACSMEGNPIWEQKSAGDCGWMVRSDFEGVYHGHSLGVTKYSPVDGAKLWHTPLKSRVLFGWLDKTLHMLYVASGDSVVSVSCDDGSTKGKTFVCDADVISTAATYGQGQVYCGDNQGFLYTFDHDGNRVAKMETQHGSVLSMHFADDNLYAVTSHGYLLCVETKNLVADPKAPETKSVSKPDDLTITLPDSTIEEVTTPGDDGVVVEFRRALTDAELLDLAKAIHDPSANMVKAEGTEHPIEEHDGRRCVKAGPLLVIAQNQSKSGKYADMAKKGDQVTWVCHGGRWALILNDTVAHNETRMLAYPATNDQKWDTTKTVQFPKKLRQEGHQYVVEHLVLSESGEFYRVQGQIRRLTAAV